MKKLIVMCPMCLGNDVQIKRFSQARCLNGKCCFTGDLECFLVGKETTMSDREEACKYIMLYLDNEPRFYRVARDLTVDRLLGEKGEKTALGPLPAGALCTAILYFVKAADTELWPYLNEMVYRSPWRLLLEHYETKAREGVFEIGNGRNLA